MTDDMRTFMIEKINEVTADVGSLLRVRRRTGNLVLSRGAGEFRSHADVYQGAPKIMCAKDAQVMYRLPINPEYCTLGVDADVVFFPTMAQAATNIAGWGGDAGKDQHGRPVVLVMGWSVPRRKIERDGGCETKNNMKYCWRPFRCVVLSSVGYCLVRLAHRNVNMACRAGTAR